ncbi:MAG: TIGR03960 family B12-binding radical SAM protein [Desulfobacterales bacterium]|nr:TIGR03960 family B12-binding radical SAM protein [Desulfobacterales bacterium]
MADLKIDPLLSLVEKPSRYMGGEINAIVKTGAEVRLRMALAFPDTYEIGMSHFGMQILYDLVNARPEACAERVFAPGIDMAKLLKSRQIPLFSLETRRPLGEFDIVGFSLLYELNYTNVLMMLDLAGIPFYADQRSSRHPFVIAGGPCTVNPEPVALFFDAMVVGDGEIVLPAMIDAWAGWKESGSGDKTELLKAWAAIEGVYVPSFFAAAFDGRGRQQTRGLLPGYGKVRRAVAPDLDLMGFPENPVIPFGKPVHDRLRLEIARGCTRGCRFCQAGMIYRPVRERSLDTLAGLVEKSLGSTGYEDLSLLSLSTGDYSCLTPLMKHLTARYGRRHLAISIPSFRAGTLTPEMMELIRSVRKTGFTIAPEAGSPRLRSVINKNISEDEIIETVSTAFDLGWQLVKLYFMIGLPTETDADIEAIAELVRRLHKLRPKGRRGGNINVSVATFIPKPHVPFQWAGQLDAATARDRMQYLRRRVKGRGVEFKWQDPETSRLEGVFARGDRRLAPVLAAAYQRGCRFDGWTDSFDKPAWDEAFVSQGVDPEFYLQAVALDAPLPWDHIDTGVSRDFLAAEYQKAIDGAPTPDCRSADCQACGVCDFKICRPIEAAEKKSSFSEPAVTGPSRADAEGPFYRVRVVYNKLGPARYFGQLELVSIFLRALRRAGVEPAYSAGFHPKPKVAFGDALPVGMESEEESFFMTIATSFSLEQIPESLNRHLPGGLRAVGCSLAQTREVPQRPDPAVYQVTLPTGSRFDHQAFEAFMQAPAFEAVFSTRKKGDQQVNLKSVVTECFRLRPDRLQIRMIQPSGLTLRPGPVVASIFSLPDAVMHQARILKLSEHAGCTGDFSEPGNF